MRTLLSAFEAESLGEQAIVETNGLVPGPHFSRELQSLSCLKGYSVQVSDCVNSSFDAVLDLVEAGYVLMLESMYNFGHWMVFLGYYPASSGSDEDASLLLYDPYYDRVRLVCLDEFLCMWQDGMHHENGVYHDFLAIRPLSAG